MAQLNKFQEATLLQAIMYARKGWHVLPTKKDKKPLNMNGSRGATVDEDTIMEWWDQWNSANIGIATGKISGFFVVDIDMKNDKNGWDSLQQRFGDNFTFEDTWLIQKTPSGGYHFLFQCPDDTEVHNAQDLLSGVDIRGEGGFILAAPSSTNINGEWIQYEWNKINNKIPLAPEWALELIHSANEKASKPLDLEQVLRGLGEGERDEGIFRFAAKLCYWNIPYDLTLAFVQQASKLCTPPFDESVARDKVDRAYADALAKKQHDEKTPNISDPELCAAIDRMSKK